MGTAAAAAGAMISSTRSFRLRSPSLNSVRLRRVFDIFDKNGDCIISVDELAEALDVLGLGQSQAQEADLSQLVQAYVQPGINGLRYQDFEALHGSLDDAFFGGNRVGDEQQQQESFESDLCEAFKVFDGDGDGYISARELQVVLAKLGLVEGQGIGMDQIQMMISSVDQDRDGRVDFYEFKDMMTRIQC